MQFLWLLLLPLLCNASDHQSPYSGDHYASYPEVIDTPAVKKGEYLVIASDCIACHSKPDGEAFAGGLPIASPFGTFYAPNITSDPDHGIGKWSEQDLINAIKHGHSPQGSLYYPALPYPYYSKMSDDDVRAIHTYLLATPPVAKPSTPHEIPFPFNIRFLVHFWNMLYFYPHQGEYVYKPKLSEKLNRGEYLVEGPGHCGMCHTPRDMLGGPVRAKAYTGGVVDGWYAPNITGTNLKKVTEGDLVRLFVYDEKPGGRGQIQGPMREVNHDSLSNMKQEDLHAIAAYIKSTVDVTPAPAVMKGADHGEVVYNAKCAACHNIGAAGAPKITDQTAWQERFKKPIETLYSNVINGYNAMSARGLCSSADDENCGDDDMKAAVNYIRNKLGIAAVTEMDPAEEKKVESDDVTANLLFEQYCSSCHNNPHASAPQIGVQKDWESRGDFDSMLKGVVLGPKSQQKGHCALPMGGCKDCSHSQIIAVLKYILNKSIQGKNYDLW